MNTLRERWAQILWDWKARRVNLFEDDALRHPAMVFAPHPDDETLGCGGLVAHKRRSGADVTIVTMTDGGRSHPDGIPHAELVDLRAQEARAAAEALGVEAGDVLLLGFRDGSLTDSRRDALQKVQDLLNSAKPHQIFIPFAYPGAPSDHAATNRIVRLAVRNLQLSPEIYEYPIWFWYHWPWVCFPKKIGRGFLKFLRDSLLAACGLRVIPDFAFAIALEDVLEIKMNALRQHHTQMSQLRTDMPWPTLPEIADGDFIANFFREYEIFHRRDV